MSKEIVQTQEMTVASKLYSIQREIALLKEDEEILKAELLKKMKDQHVKSVKLDDDTMFIIAERQTLKIKDKQSAFNWALENNSLDVDTTKAWKILRRELKLPKFFIVNKSEYLRIWKPK